MWRLEGTNQFNAENDVPKVCVLVWKEYFIINKHCLERSIKKTYCFKKIKKKS